MRARGWTLLPALLLLAIAAPVFAQQILLDKPVKAGDLTLFPDLNDDKAYYYLPDKPRIAEAENGRPQFSFLRWVQNVRAGADSDDAREGDGGGIVHAVVLLGVTDEQITDAQRALQRQQAGAKIQGPIMYRSGKFGLVSSFKDTEGNLSTQVLGLGNAPILDGQKAAISIQLTKLGAQILWESFNTETPDISFTFEMDLAGYRSPKRALIEADFDQVYTHEAFGAGLATPYLAGEIKAAFDDLQRKGAIKVTQVGEDDKLDALITTAYNKIAEMMFQPIGGTGTPSLASLSKLSAGGMGLLDRATKLLAASRAEVDKENAAASRGTVTPTTTPKPAPTTAPAATPKPATTTATGANTGAKKSVGMPKRYGASPPSLAGTHTDKVKPPKTAATPLPKATPRKPTPKPAFAVVAAYEMKRVRQRGTFRIDLNKYTSDSVTLRFDENIGNLSALKEDESHFRQVNLDDPLYRQREILVMVDGADAADFGDYINFATVQMRKKHARGDETLDEVRIDRNNFNREGNAFRLMYGWKNDQQRDRWNEYEYRVEWSFFGGHTVSEDWTRGSANSIAAVPAYRRASVNLDADPDMLEQAEVRLVTVKIFYQMGDRELVKQATLNPSKEKLSETVYFVLPAGEQEYEYEISWRLRGNRTVSSGRQRTDVSTLLCDEVQGE